MRILKWVGGILAAIVVIFFLIGVFVPTFTYVSRIEVNAPVEHAWAVFNDESRVGEWMTGFKSIETISGNPNEVGSKFRLVFEEDGKEIVMTETMTAFEPHERFAFDLVNEVMNVNVDIRFASSGGKTEITATSLVDGNNIFWKSLLPLFKSGFEDRSQEMYDKLKTLIETTEVSSSSTT